MYRHAARSKRSRGTATGLALALTTTVLGLVAAWPARGSEPLPAARPETLGLSAERLARLGAAMRTHVERGELAGVVVLVARRGQIAYFEAFGKREIAAGAPMERDTIFRIYSMTKPVTSVAALLLLEEGKLLLGDPVTKYVPELAGLRVLADPAGPLDRTVSLEREITIRDLLTHTAGFTYDQMAQGPIGEANGRLEREAVAGGLDLPAWIRRLAALPLVHQPATLWHYGVSTDVLGQVVAVASGLPLDVFFRERIFGPLGMVDTDFSVPAEKLQRFAASYGPGERGELVAIDTPATSPYRLPPRWLSGGGGLVSTAGDFLRFCQMLLGGGELEGTRLLGRKTVELMTRNHLSDAELEAPFLRKWFPGWGFGLGVAVVTDVARTGLPGSEGEYGWNGAASTSFWVDPAEELIAIQMTQLMPFRSGLPSELRALVYSAIAD
jgi:CubicO group peptidase (beta-lactamase class C family)